MLYNGRKAGVAVIQRYLAVKDICPECDSGIRIAVARDKRNDLFFRLECHACGWTTEALPDPEVE